MNVNTVCRLKFIGFQNRKACFNVVGGQILVILVLMRLVDCAEVKTEIFGSFSNHSGCKKLGLSAEGLSVAADTN